MPELLKQQGSMTAMIDHSITEDGRNLIRYHPPELNDVQEEVAESGILDPERPDDLFEPFAKTGLFRKGSRLERARNRWKGKWRK